MKNKILAFLFMVGVAQSETLINTAAPKNPIVWGAINGSMQYQFSVSEIQSEAKDIVIALRSLLPKEDPLYVTTEYRPPMTEVQRLQKELEEAKQRESDIAHARSVLAKWEARVGK